MFKTAASLVALAALILVLQGAASALWSGPQEAGKVVVGKEGLKLYPRLNRSLKPLADLEEGKVLLVLRELKAWKQVQVEGSDVRGWIVGDVKKGSPAGERKYDTVADPATTGLVARGWSKDYAARHGTNLDKVDEIRKRSLDPERFKRFLEGEVLK